METKLNINAIEKGSIPIDKLSVDTIKSIISDDCKIYYQGTIDTSILPAFGDAVLIADIREGRASFEGSTYAPVFKTLIFDRPITVIPDNAFINQSGLGSIIFPSLIGIVGANIFEGCTNLYYIDMSNISLEIPTNAFTNFSNSVASTIIVDYINNMNFTLVGFESVFKEIKYGQLSMTELPKHNVLTKKTTRYFENNSFSSGFVPIITNSIIKFKNPFSGSINFYMNLCGSCTVIFSIGEIVPSISFSTSTKWANDNPPTFKPNKTYEIYFPGNSESQCLTWVSYSN